MGNHPSSLRPSHAGERDRALNKGLNPKPSHAGERDRALNKGLNPKPSHAGERDRALNEMNGVFVGSRAIRVSLATAKKPGVSEGREMA